MARSPRSAASFGVAEIYLAGINDTSTGLYYNQQAELEGLMTLHRLSGGRIGSMATIRRERPAWFLLEPVITIAIALVLYFPLNKKDLAELTAIFGALVTVANIAQTVRLRSEFAQVARLAEIVDLQHNADNANLRDLLRLYSAINEPELRPLKDDVVEHCNGVLAKLAHDKVSAKINSSEYYIWLNDVMDKSFRGEKVRAISVMEESGWVLLPAERKFLDANIRCAKKGVSIQRIFVTTRERVASSSNCAVINEHISNAQHGLEAFVVWEDDLARHDPTLAAAIGAGFISFNDRVALVDVSVPPNEARGLVTMSSAQLRSLRRTFEQLMLHAEPAEVALARQSDRRGTP